MSEFDLGGGRTIKIVIDDTPPKPFTTVNRWDEWFEATGDQESQRAWKVTKEVHGLDPVALDVWASVIELNRLDRIRADKAQTPPESTGGV